VPDTESARDDLRIARQYIDKYYDENQGPYFTGLDRAIRYIASARQKDINVTLKAKGSQKLGGIIDWTPNLMEGEALGIRGTYLSNSDKRDVLKEAIDLLERSVALFAMPTFYKALALSYNKMGRRADAAEILRQARQKWPDNMEIQEYVDQPSAAATSATSTCAK
jgi:tetratricopeptide (TPR) repeat protein